MQVYPISEISSKYSAKRNFGMRNSFPPSSGCQAHSVNKQVSFGNNALRNFLILAGGVTLAVFVPALALVGVAAGATGLLAAEIAGSISDNEAQKRISENGKDMIDDSIKDSFPY